MNIHGENRSCFFGSEFSWGLNQVFVFIEGWTRFLLEWSILDPGSSTRIRIRNPAPPSSLLTSYFRNLFTGKQKPELKKPVYLTHEVIYNISALKICQIVKKMVVIETNLLPLKLLLSSLHGKIIVFSN